jgi:hypothetical protein
MSISSKKPEEWKSCEPGYLVALSNRAKSARRRRFAVRVSTSIAVLICAAGLGLWSSGLWSTPRENYFGGIACHEVQEKMPAMMAGTLPDDLKARIEAHLLQCPACREMMQKMQAGQAVGMATREHWYGECPDCEWRVADVATLAVASTHPHTVRGTESRVPLTLAREM